MKLRRVGVVGAGVMGSGVAQRLAEHGHDVVLMDRAPAALTLAKESIEDSVRLGMLLGRLPRSLDVSQMIARISLTTDVQRLHGLDFVIENVREERRAKTEVHAAIAEICHPGAVIAANSSAIPITEIASMSSVPGRVIGLHFMNPVPQKSVIEVIRGVHTTDETVQTAQTLLAQMGMRGIVVRDGAGYVANRVSHLFMNEAIWVVQDQLAPPADVDAIFRECYGHTIGPLQTADLIGLDTVLDTLEVLYESYRDCKFRPAPLLRRMVAAGLRGRKSGEGFYKYT